MKMKNNLIHFSLLIFSLISPLYTQLDFGANYEFKYFDGKDGEDNFNVFENYLDMSVYYNDWYFYSLLRYKDPALIGLPTQNIDDVYNIFYLEYYNDNIQIQIGDVFQSYGTGLSMHTYEDRTIDYNNAPRGISLLYYFNDSIDIFSTIGESTFYSRTSPSNIEPDIFIDNQIALMGFSYQNNYFDMYYLSKYNNQNIGSSTIINMKSFDNILGDYLKFKYPILGQDPDDFNMKILEHNFGTTIYIKDLEVYFEKSWIYHNKIGAERHFSNKIYLSSYYSVNGYGILYEYKDYNAPYFYSVFSNPPIVFKENSSTLISRNLHNVDFSNEVGHHIVINKSYSEQLNILLSSACSYQHLIDNDLPEPGFDQVLSDMLLQRGNMGDYQVFKPYRQLYFELNGWTKNENLFYKIGLDKYLEYSTGKIISARTLPAQVTLKLKEGNSISVYLEHQVKEDLSNLDKNYYVYFSPSYNHFGKWIFSLFGDFSMTNRLLGINDIKEGYKGVDITYYITDNNVLSIFMGSQKGGLVCANGTCVMQPDFEKGFKVTSKILF